MKFPEVGSAKSVPFGTRLTSLDGLRGLAVLSVVIYHALHFTGQPSLLGKIWRPFHGSAWAGVDLFFVLSGFLITGILLESRGQPNYFRNFYARRTLRIFPLYYAVLLIAILIVPHTVGISHMPAMYPRLIERQLWLWTYMQNYLQATTAHTLPGFGHFWTLAVEEQFYWVWPLAVLLLPRKHLLHFCVVICAILPFARLALVLSGESTWAVRQYTHTRVDTLLYGAIAAIVVRDSGLLEKYHRSFIIAAGTASLILVVLGIKDGFVPFESIETAFLGYSAFGVLFAVLIGYLVTTVSRVSDLLSSRILCWLGTYSYGIYVFHWPITQAVRASIEPRLKHLDSNWIPGVASLIIVLSASSLAAYLSFIFYESQFLKLKRLFVYSAPKTTSISAASTCSDFLQLNASIQHNSNQETQSVSLASDSEVHKNDA